MSSSAPVPLSFQDAMFLIAETPTAPTHVGGIEIYRIPEGRDDFVGNLVEDLCAQPVAEFWTRKLQPGSIGGKMRPHWVQDPNFDLDFHVRRIAVPEPGSRAQMYRIIERIHATNLDRNRPLWEIYFIEGLAADGRTDAEFAVYSRMSHALIDGMAGVYLAMNKLSTAPDAPPIAPWSVEAPRPSEAQTPSLFDRFRQMATRSQELRRLAAETGLDWMANRMGARKAADLPFSAPGVMFNRKVDAHRNFDATSIDIERVKAVAKAAGGTVNDVAVALTGAALREWLGGMGELPEKSLIASCPVSVRQGTGVGNSVSLMMSDLATDETDPLERLKRVMASTARGKRQIGALSPEAAESWATLMGVGALLPALAMGNRPFAPMGNLVVSNVPGPRVPMYCGGAELVGYFPVSIVANGAGLNVTLLSRAGALDFGVIGARSLAPNLALLMRAFEKAMDALETAVREDVERRNRALVSVPVATVDSASVADGDESQQNAS